ncbi:MAG: 2'-5' RNA ligase family protein [Acidobacteriaceae bacterium]|nr:2'-5' RNA ligase family protein [Acidobacteriaceae bacterium]
MPRYRIHRMKEAPRESFRWAAHTGGLAAAKPKDYESSDEIEASSPYQAWKLMAEQGRALHPGDLLEIHGSEAGPRDAPQPMWIAKYVGLEPAQWWIPDAKPALVSGVVPKPFSSGEETCSSQRNGLALIDPESFDPIDGHEKSLLGWFAVVCYVPDPQRSFLNSLRHSIPGKPLSPVHVTVLPPRPLRSPANEACVQAQKVAGEFSAFEAQLSEVRSFSNTDFLYLDIAEGSSTLYEVHRRLAVGRLEYSEAYDFRPHITLGGPVPASSLPAVQQRISDEWRNSDCPRRVLIEELVCLWMAPDADGKHWERHASFLLPAKVPSPPDRNRS